MSVWKWEFAKELGVSPQKLDDLMNTCNLSYWESPRDRKLKIVSDEDQEIIKTYLETGIIPK